MTLKRWGPIFMILSLVAAVAVPAMADYLGPNRTVTTYVWKRLHCRYQAIYDPPGAGWYGCYLHLYQTPDSTCPSTDSVVTFFNPKDCSWPSDFCQDPGCSITLSSSKEDCSEGQTGCRATETTVTHPPATVSGSLTCAVPGDNGWCRGGGQLGLSGTEPLSGYSILALEGTRNGETFACTGASCSVPLVEGTNDFTFWALSSWGDSSLKGTASGKLDSSPPVISGELTGTAGESGWYVSEVMVAASASDAVSGVATFEMALDGGGWAAYNGPVALTDSDHVVDLRAMDSAGNVSTQSQAVRVDTQPPSLTLDADASFCPGCGETLGIGIGIQDLGSGVMEWTLSVDGTAIKSGSGLSSETLNWNGSGLAAGAHTLLLQARDVAGNSSEASQGVTLVAPTQPPPPPPTTVPSRPREDAPVATATPTATSTSTPSVVNEASPTPTHTADYEPTRTPSTFIFGGPPAAPPDELPGEGLTRPDSAPGESLTGSGSAPGESLTAPEPAVEGDSSNVLWGAGAAALIAAATAVALEATRRRKEAEAREREEIARRNAQAEAREEAERQRQAALAAARQETELRLEELAERQDTEQIRAEASAARQEAWQQHHAPVQSARQEAKLQLKAARNVVAGAAAAVAAATEALRRASKRVRLERNEETPVATPPMNQLQDISSPQTGAGPQVAKSAFVSEETISEAAGPVLEPVPSFWSSPFGWFQASLINAGRQDETTRRVLTGVLAPAADSLKSIANEDRNPSIATFHHSFWRGIEAWGGVVAALNETRRYTSRALQDHRWDDAGRGAVALAQESWELTKASFKAAGLTLWGIATTPVRIFTHDIPEFAKAISERQQGKDRAWDVLFTGTMLGGDLAGTYALAKPTGIVNRINLALERRLFGSLDLTVPTEFLPPGVTGQWQNWSLPDGVAQADQAISWQAMARYGLYGPNRELPTPPGRMLSIEDGGLLTLPQGDLNSLPIGEPTNPAEGFPGDPNTRLLWTADERGVNFALEMQPWDSGRGIPTHTNVSQQAYAAGEAWRTGPDQLTVSAASRAYGFNDKLGVEMFAEAAVRYESAINFLRSLGIDVKALPFGLR
jgi:hypothetical protein